MRSTPFISIRPQGLEQVKKALRTLGAAAANRVIRKGVTAGIQVYSKAMKAAAPKETGLLKKSIGHKVKTYRMPNSHTPAHYTPSARAGQTVGFAGARTGFKRQVTIKIKNKKGRTVGKRQEIRDPIKYAHLTEAHKPWMKPTFIGQRGQVESAVISAMRSAVDGALLQAAAAGRTK